MTRRSEALPDEYDGDVEATGYGTEAERFGWSFVFHLFVLQRLARKVNGVAGD